MSTKFTHADRVFLRACGIVVESPTFAEERMELARRIARHLAPGYRKDGTLETLEELGLPLTRENYLMLGFMGDPPEELDGEIEAMLPDGIRLADDEEEN